MKTAFGAAGGLHEGHSVPAAAQLRDRQCHRQTSHSGASLSFSSGRKGSHIPNQIHHTFLKIILPQIKQINIFMGVEKVMYKSLK